MLNTPAIFDALDETENVLIAGAGGGFDVFAGLPFLHWLRSEGKGVHLANLSFTELGPLDDRPTQNMVRVTADSLDLAYFPEKFLAEWLRSQGSEMPVYAFERTGVVQLAESYAWLADELGIDTVLLVDGGTDSLMRGDEAGLGTPYEDMISISAVHGTAVERKLIVSVGFGVDSYHGVSHAHFLEAVARLIRSGHFLGSIALERGTPEAVFYAQAVEYVHARMPHHPSIVSSSVIAAVDGEFGDHHPTARTRGTEMVINPLMSLYWAFQLDGLVEQSLYLDQLKRTRSRREVELIIGRFRVEHPELKPWQPIPH